MNPNIDRQRLECFEINSWPAFSLRSLMLIAALLLCLGITAWAQVPGVSFTQSSPAQFLPGKALALSQAPPPTNALALRQRMRQSPTFTTETRSSAVASRPAAAANSVQYSYAYINIPNSPFIQPNAINDFGLVVGWYLDASNNYHGFIWQSGTLQYVDHPGALDTTLLGVNNLGQIIGAYEDASFITHVATYSPSGSSWSDLPTIPGGWQDYVGAPISLNDEGEALGCASSDTLPLELTWIWHPERQAYSYFTSAAASPGSTCGEAMNDWQTVVGQMATAYGYTYLFVGDHRSGYPFVPLPPSLQGTLVGPFGLNNFETVAGTIYFPSDNSVSAFLRDRDGVFTIVNDAAWPQTYLTGLNDFGVLVGDVYDPATGLSPGIIAYPQGWHASSQQEP